MISEKKLNELKILYKDIDPFLKCGDVRGVLRSVNGLYDLLHKILLSELSSMRVVSVGCEVRVIGKDAKFVVEAMRVSDLGIEEIKLIGVKVWYPLADFEIVVV